MRQFFPARAATRTAPYPSMDFPALEARHLAGAGLFANREALIASLPLAAGGTIAEIGVAHGEFSEFLLGGLVKLRPGKGVVDDADGIAVAAFKPLRSQAMCMREVMRAKSARVAC